MENWLEKGFKIGEKVMFFVYENWIYKVIGVVEWMEKYLKSIQETYEKMIKDDILMRENWILKVK